jgi:CheY-like chemotaxis protein
MQINRAQPANTNVKIEGLMSGLDAERKAREAAEAADAAKTGLLALMGRDLRAPMESAAAMANQLLSSPAGVSQRHDIETFAQSARALFDTLHDVLDYADLETGAAEVALEPFDLHALVKDAASTLQARAGAKSLTSAVEMTPDCPRFIVGDVRRVRQVLMGLIEAALQRTTEGSIRLYASVNEAAHPFTVRFDITDTGAGLTEAEIDNLFQPCSGTSRVGGSLGLPIALRLAEAMGGGLGCTSAVGQGTLHWFTFQSVAADEQDAAKAQAAPKPETPAPQSETKAPREGALSGHVLLVEGNSVNRMLIGAYLDEIGLTYETADNGAAALMCLASRPYDLVLMDTVLPDYDGSQMAKRIRTMQAPSSDVPIVGITASGSSEDLQGLVEAGLNARVTKPIQGRALYAALVPFLPAQA